MQKSAFRPFMKPNITPDDHCIFCGCHSALHNLKRRRHPVTGPNLLLIMLTCMECAYQKRTHQVVCFLHTSLNVEGILRGQQIQYPELTNLVNEED